MKKYFISSFFKDKSERLVLDVATAYANETRPVGIFDEFNAIAPHTYWM